MHLGFSSHLYLPWVGYSKLREFGVKIISRYKVSLNLAGLTYLYPFLAGILESIWDKHSVTAATPPPSPTSGESGMDYYNLVLYFHALDVDFGCWPKPNPTKVPMVHSTDPFLYCPTCHNLSGVSSGVVGWNATHSVSPAAPLSHQ